ncbi:MAG TPA: CoA transferase [Candidatus Kryptonia bacterium]|nr:CoA transferase [Candidatus Kryptonia bacterium]
MRVLDGIRLIEVADWGFIPSAGTVLGDWGADVIKVEHPVRGDPIRGLVTSGIVPGAKGVNFFTEQLGRNKRSVGIDLATEAGRALLYKLVETADIFLTNYLGEARQKLKITYDDLKAINPRLIYAKGHGQGQKGPDANRGGYDAASFWARGGVADRLSTPGQPLVGQRPAFGDFIGGMFVAGGIAGALFHRERTGEGVEVDVSLLGNAVWILSPDIVASMAYGFELPQSGLMGSPNPLVNTYWSSDGKGVVLMMLQGDRFWPIFCKTVGREDLLEDPRFNPPQQRQMNGPQLVELLRQMFATKTRAEWAEILNASECIWAPVQSPAEVVEDRQVKANGYILNFEHPNFGPFRVASSPVQFNGEPPEVRSAAPDVGAHTEEVLLSLGYDWEALGKLKADGVIS